MKGFACNYGAEGGDRIVIVEVDPADVVSVPTDCSCQKVRTCRYTVVDEFRGELPGVSSMGGSSAYSTDEDPDFDLDLDGDDEDVYSVSEIDEIKTEAYEAGREAAIAEMKGLIDREL